MTTPGDDAAERRMEQHIDAQMEQALKRLEAERLEKQRQEREEQKKVQDARRAEFAKLNPKERANVIREHVERTGGVPELAQIRYLMELGRPEPGNPGVTRLPGAPESGRDPRRAQQERDSRGKDGPDKGRER